MSCSVNEKNYQNLPSCKTECKSNGKRWLEWNGEYNIIKIMNFWQWIYPYLNAKRKNYVNFFSEIKLEKKFPPVQHLYQMTAFDNRFIILLLYARVCACYSVFAGLVSSYFAPLHTDSGALCNVHCTHQIMWLPTELIRFASILWLFGWHNWSSAIMAVRTVFAKNPETILLGDLLYSN